MAPLLWVVSWGSTPHTVGLLIIFLLMISTSYYILRKQQEVEMAAQSYKWNTLTVAFLSVVLEVVANKFSEEAPP